MTKKKSAAQQAQAEIPPSTSSLIICRNKHWRYISSFHGPWLQLPPEILDSLAHQNFTMPSPRLIDPAVFYDIVKIRKAVDEAAQDAVRASTGLSNNALNGRMDYFGAGGGPGSQLSKERIFKIRQKAVKALSKAFALDEVAASVASMQGTSTVHDVGQHVLKREPNNIDAKYVHYFHEKIPSRSLENNTPLEPLTEIIGSLPLEQQAPSLRTRGIVQLFKSQWDGAVADFTSALRITEELKRMHKPNQQQLELASRMREEQEAWSKSHRDWRSVPHLKEEDQPQSLEQQLLFNRAGAYLTIACQNVHAALDGMKEYQEKQETGEVSAEDAKAQALRLEARKKVKTNAKRALKDYSAFLSHFDYTPGLPFEFTNEIMRRVHDLSNGTKFSPSSLQNQQNRALKINDGDDGVKAKPANGNNNTSLVRYQETKSRGPKASTERAEDGWPQIPPPKIHPASALFAEKPPPDLPVFPALDSAHSMHHDSAYEAFGSREAVTYHPLLTDSLHSLLLAHALLQTSPTELLRHANNAARLARVADGYPLFQAARSPARADWIEVLRRANNWLGLTVPWQKLCAPAPLPESNDSMASLAKTSNGHVPHAGDVMERFSKRREPKGETEEQKRERIKQESIIDALSDDRVVDEKSFQQAVRARERRALEDEQGISGPLKDKDATSSAPSSTSSPPGEMESGNSGPKRWAQEENGKEYPISTVRAEAIARWIKEAPLSMGGKKKRPARKSRPSAANKCVHDVTNGVGDLGVHDSKEEDGPD